MNKAWTVLAVGIAALCLAVGVAIGTGMSKYAQPNSSAMNASSEESRIASPSMTVRSLRLNALSLNGKKVSFRAVVADCVFRGTTMEAIVLADSSGEYTQALMGRYSGRSSDIPENISVTARPAPIGFTMDVAGQFEGVYDAISNTVILTSATKVQ